LAEASPPAARDPRAPLVVVDDFLPNELAEAMRTDIDRHFTDPQPPGSETRQVWEYRFDRQLHTVLRTTPEKIIRADRCQAFVNALQSWSFNNLAMARVSGPLLSLHVPGCAQEFQSGAREGRFGFVYSLTRDERRSAGGATLVMRETDPFRHFLTNPSAAASFHESFEPRFNRLLVFDDRLPHAVSRVEGPMDPAEGRFALYGHLSETGPLVHGALPLEAVARPVSFLLKTFAIDATARIALYRGILGLRLLIAPDGTVSRCAVIVDRVIHPDPGDVEWDSLRDDLVERMMALTFPAAPAETILTQPVVFGEPIPSPGTGG
jgi:hypothetical protein